MHERFAAELNRLMETHEPPLSIRDLSEKLGLTYEFVRKLLRGQNLPTHSSVVLISRIFDAPAEELKLLVQEDKCATEYGRAVASVLFHPTLRSLIEKMSKLGDDEREHVLRLLHDLLEAVRAR